MSGRQPASRRVTRPASQQATPRVTPVTPRRMIRQTSRRQIRLRRTIAVTVSAALGVALLGALDALPLPGGSVEGAAVVAASADPQLDLVAPSRPSSASTVAVPTPTPTPVASQLPTPAPDVKPPAPPALPASSGSGKRIVYGIAAQQVWLVDAADAVVRTYMVSGSKYDQLDPGTYEVFSKSETTTSWHGTETMEYMVRFHRGARANIGFHDIPVDTSSGTEVQTLAELGTALSDGCIRQDVVDAQALWDFAPVGTPVVVLA
jgi:lipoprotein-anchoring transpeptidase ErfK/SrfK